MEAMRELFGAYRVMEIFFYYDRLRETLELAAPEGVGEPGVAVVTRGVGDPAFFEHRRIVEVGDIVMMTLAEYLVSEGFVFAREDGRRIDVIYRCFDEDYVDTDLPDKREPTWKAMLGPLAYMSACPTPAPRRRNRRR